MSEVKKEKEEVKKVYPSAYAKCMLTSKAVCSGKVTPGGKKEKRKKMADGGVIDMTMMMEV